MRAEPRITLKNATLGDEKNISELITPLMKKYVFPTIEAAAHDIVIESVSEKSIKNYLSENHQYMLAIKGGSKLVGVIGMRDKSHLLHLFVCESIQGSGVSRMLWEAMKEKILAEYDIEQFTVNSAINAKSVYLSFGFFETQGIRNRSGMIDIPMVLNIPS